MDLYHFLKKLKKSRFGKLMRHRSFNVAAAVVVFVTTYMLILPAITQTGTTYCGKEEHKHSDDCYTVEKLLICELEESEGHTHTDACLEWSEELVCSREESAGHSHSDFCYETEEHLTCTSEDPEHEHDSSCYTTEKKLVCSKEESEGHTHGESCYEKHSTVVCGKEESEGHTHTDECYKEEKTLTCTREEHTHASACYANPNADKENESSWSKNLKKVKLSGNWAEDLITVAETQLGYKESSSNYIVDENGKKKGYTRYGDWYGNEYGDWCAMYVSFCLHYAGVPATESKGVKAEDGTKVYMPISAGCQNWIEKLNTKEAPYYYAVNDKNSYKLINDSSDFEPQVGNLIFFNWDKQADADHVGIIVEVKKNKDGEITQIKTIEGNSSSKVKYNTYSPSNKKIMGYAVLPTNPNAVASEVAVEIGSEKEKEKTSEQNTAEQKAEAGILAEAADEASGSDTEAEIENTAGEERITRSYDGADFHITLTYGADAGIPEEALVMAEELTGKEYEKACQDAMEAMGLSEISFARFFNISFVADGEEFEPTGTVEVQITYDEPLEVGTEEVGKAVHFADDGTEILDMVEEHTDEGTVLTFEQESFSTTGTVYGISLLADDEDVPTTTALDSSSWPKSGPVSAKVVSAPTVGKWYILYGAYNGTGTALTYSGTNHTGTDLTSPNTTIGSTVNYLGNADVVWMWDGNGFVNREGKYLYAVTATSNNYFQQWELTGGLSDSYENAVKYSNQYHILYNQSTTTNQWGATVDQVTNYIYIDSTRTQQKHQRTLTLKTPSGTEISQNANNWGNTWTDNTYYGYPQYIAEIETTSNYPQPALTGEISLKDIMFYNVDASHTDGTYSYLKGVQYTIYDSNGDVEMTVTTEDRYDATIGKLPAGTYYIEQTAVPAGYVVVPQRKSFTVDSEGYANIGVFMDYKAGDEGYVAEKNAQVIDYANRIYQVTLGAASGDYTYSIADKDYYLVVDQSNSMLFPAQLTEVTGKSVTLSTSANVNGARMNALNLDTSQVYYIIADESVTSTMYAVWWDGNGWCYQDASFYEKAWAHVHGFTKNVLESGKYVTFPTASQTYGQYTGGTINGETYTKTNGGGLNMQLSGSTLSKDITAAGGQKTYQIYTSTTSFTRLRDIQLSSIMLATVLDSLGNGNSITLELFNKKVFSCNTYQLNGTSSLKTFISAIKNITSTGGTRQDRALRHLLGQVSTATDSTGHNTTKHIKNGDIVIMITDGAPIYSDSTTNSYTGEGNYVNTNNSDATNNYNLLHSAIPAAATAVKQAGATLVTVGLGISEVEGGSEMLRNAASSLDLFCEPESEDELREFLVNTLFRLGSQTAATAKGSVTDVVSDSFYPINIATGQPLPTESDTLIDLNGNVISSVPSDGKYGTIHYNAAEKQWEVTWSNQALPEYYLNKDARWNGHIYLKAKEDFIGGNTIDTNSDAQVQINKDDGTPKFDAITMETPTVNVRLLPIDGLVSEETVFLGDSVAEIKEKIQYLFEQTVISKINPYYGTDNIRNYKDTTASTDGLNSDSFSIPYAIGELTEAQWTALLNGESITIEYIYDDDSSHGAVGYFTFALTASGDYPDSKTDASKYGDHTTEETGVSVEEYKLTITYTAYTIGQSDEDGDIRKENVHNSTNEPNTLVRQSLNRDGTNSKTNGWPGTEVGGSGAGSTLETGRGTETAEDIHYVHVIDGEIFLTKVLDESLLPTTEDLTFYFKLNVKDADGRLTVSELSPVEVTVPAGSAEATVTIGPLPRGQYVIEEVENSQYAVSGAKVKQEDTSAVSTESSESLEFDIGTNESITGDDKDVIIVLDEGPDYQKSMYVNENRYVYSYPFENPIKGGTHIETSTVTTYDWTSGTIITTDVSGSKYVKSTSTAAQLDASHTSYGILTQSEDDDDSWTIEWHTWTSEENTVIVPSTMTYNGETVSYNSWNNDFSTYTDGSYYHLVDGNYKKVTRVTRNNTQLIITTSDGNSYTVNSTGSSGSGWWTTYYYNYLYKGTGNEGSTTTETVWSVATTTASADSSKIPTTTVTHEVEVENPPSTAISDKLSYGHGEITNRKADYKVPIPVKKEWTDGKENHTGDEVYVVLYRSGDSPSPVMVTETNEDGTTSEPHAMMLKLNSDNGWKGSFTISASTADYNPLADGYIVREVNDRRDKEFTDSFKAVLVEGDPNVQYVTTVAENGTVSIDYKGYYVHYDSVKNADGNPKMYVVTNSKAYELPETGGIGTTKYTMGGITLMLLALVLYLFVLRHRQERRFK